LIAGEMNLDLVLLRYHSFPALGKEVLVEDVSLTLGSSSAICAAGLVKLGNRVSLAAKLDCDSFGSFGITVSISSTQKRALMTRLGSIAALRASDISEPYIEKPGARAQ
jgi:sugar/nucleoside kinase (ribokinase family)